MLIVKIAEWSNVTQLTDDDYLRMMVDEAALCRDSIHPGSGNVDGLKTAVIALTAFRRAVAAHKAAGKPIEPSQILEVDLDIFASDLQEAHFALRAASPKGWHGGPSVLVCNACDVLDAMRNAPSAYAGFFYAPRH